MISLISKAALALACIFPVVAFAQTSQPVSRAQVRSELSAIERAGYSPTTASDYDYPSKLQAAEARVVVQASIARTDNSGYGTSAGGTSQAGRAGEASSSPLRSW
ncbi:DUF4148 domain-containing protein [Paraburkholderia pallida]|uniref:DUF4148 domain-containing protein n=1 Tax=Paraburkholderia pallida TaxID=2547399 RepID=A0A4P7D0Q3_9BURK|nr:DUF4148 domain-containing protein [Paraburkholderia pallida]QBR02241.1 DUF4148 domain-containing protein [Paraburkholderia pallida]